MEKSGIIRHYNIVPNESKYPYLHYKVLIGLRNISEEREIALKEYCRINKNIVYIVKSLGPWEFEIDLEVASADKFREIIMDIKNSGPSLKTFIIGRMAYRIYREHLLSVIFQI